jgi:hypothetical protein
VHPTGMAVDLRKPRDGTCLRWLRTVLLDLERTGVLEATEEFGPPHFHVAVFPTSYARYAAARIKADERGTVALAGAPAATYTVRPGDTLWEIARTHDTTVDAIAGANALVDEVIQPGQELQIPGGG